MTTAPVSLNLMALPTRLSTTCVSRRSSPWPFGMSGWRLDLEAELLVVGERLDRAEHVVEHVLHRIVGERERELAGLDLGEVEHVVDQAEQVAAVALDALEHGLRLLRRLAVDAVEDQLGVAEDGVERRAQLVAHVGEELRLVLARDRELLALLLDLVEQVGVLDRHHRLVGEGLQQVDGGLAGIRPASCAAPPARRRCGRGAAAG